MREPSSERTMRAQIAAHVSWANTPDRPARTAAARQAAFDRFERQVDPDGVLTPEERHKRAENARRAYFLELALKSAQSRRRAAEALADADAAERELRQGGVA